MGTTESLPTVHRSGDEDQLQLKATAKKKETSSLQPSIPQAEEEHRYVIGSGSGVVPNYGKQGRTPRIGETTEFERTGRTRELPSTVRTWEKMPGTEWTREVTSTVRPWETMPGTERTREVTSTVRPWETMPGTERTRDVTSTVKSREMKPSTDRTRDLPCASKPSSTMSCEFVAQSAKPATKRESQRERHLRERKLIKVEIEDAKAQLSQKFRATEERIRAVKCLPISPVQIQDMERRMATIRENFQQGIMKVYQDSDETFSKLLKNIETIEMEQSPYARMDWEELDNLIVRMTMMYSQILVELDGLEVHIVAEEKRVSEKMKAQSVKSESTETAAPFLRSQADKVEASSSLSDCREMAITINQSGGFFDITEFGLILRILPNTVVEPTNIKCTIRPKQSLPSPAGNMETIVSHIVELGPHGVHLQQPFIVTLLHSGPGREYGYETVAKAFNHQQLVWEEIKEFESKAEDYVQVQITKLTILAVVSRLISDRFEVTSKGCVVKSSVCKDVMLQFPKGAVAENVNGSLEVLMMPKTISTSGYPCPVLFVNGLEGMDFLKYVVVRMPHPCPARYPVGEIYLMCLEMDQWKDITNQTDRVICVEHQTYIELHVQHFSGLWPWLNSVSSNFVFLFQYLCHSPQAVCFAAFKERHQFLSPKITLLCVANHDEERMRKMKDDGYTRLARNTARKKMRPNDKAYLKLDGRYETHHTDREFFMQFLHDEPYIAELCVRRTGEVIQDENLILLFFSNKEATNEDELVCKLDVNEITTLPDDVPHRQYDEVDSDEDQGYQSSDIISSFGAEERLLTISAEEVAGHLPRFLNVQSRCDQDPPSNIMKQCRLFCRMLKDIGRIDIVEALRNVLPSGMTGPISDGNTLVGNMDSHRRRNLTRHLSVTEKWRPLAEQLGVSNTDMLFYEARTRNHSMAILDQYGAHLTVNQLYKLLLRIDANAIADYL